MLNVALVVAGILLLTLGGEVLIRGALGAARRFGVSPLLSGLVIVGFGTSAPELVVSVNAALGGQPDIAIGNVVGSNIGNVLLILGLCAVIMPLSVQPLALRRDATTVIGASVLFMLLVMGGELNRIGALVLLASLAAYLAWAYRTERAPASSAPGAMHAAEADEVQPVPPRAGWILGALGGGLVLLIAGSQVLLHGAVGIAESLGLSKAVIGLTLVAVGTSLPELTVSVIAALRRHADVAVGNILGSNIFNLLGILGVAGLMAPLPLDERILGFDQWVMLATAVLLLAFLYTGRRLSRTEGAVLLGAYAAYLLASFALIAN
ncbi:calcium/sodium antiporter [Pseudomonas sp.]|jgi:cation:H+ antiporter|uniref:calcium/sodium antiporter n=1 Tax=Pseudomonas sp. TaxID=306 RepID=UPI00272A74AE|nr:calcium/sodium antiporter [Pseudomonas sp.]